MNNRLKPFIVDNFSLFVGVPVFLWQILFFCLPLVFVIILSVYDLDKSGFLPVTFEYFQHFLKPAYARVILRSLILALLSASICFAAGYPLAYFLAFRAERYKMFFLFLLIVPFWTNFLLHVYAWFFVLERGGFLNTLLLKLGLISGPLHVLNTYTAIVIMMVYYYLPFMVLPLYAILEKFDLTLIEASYDLGASWWQTFRKIMLPLSLPGILSGFFLVFVPSFAEFAIPELMGGDKRMFVGTVVSHYILGGLTKSLGAAFTILTSVVLIVSALILYWLIKKIVKSL